MLYINFIVWCFFIYRCYCLVFLYNIYIDVIVWVFYIYKCYCLVLNKFCSDFCRKVLCN